MTDFEGKRFAAFIITIFVLVGGVMLAPTESFIDFAKTVGFVFGAYAVGQSATDWIEEKRREI